MRRTMLLILAALALTATAAGQRLVSPVVDDYRVTDADLLTIVKAEDARDPAPVNTLLKSVNTATRYRAALAAGRIGDASSLDQLTEMLGDRSVTVRTMAAFAIGELELAKGSDAILRLLRGPKLPDAIRARGVEAAGKIAAANPRHGSHRELGEVIVAVLVAEADNPTVQNDEVILLGITAALRARPEKAGEVTARFLTHRNARIRGDAANTLARLRAKNGISTLRTMVLNDPDANARANAARALGAAEDRDSLTLLHETGLNDRDSRVRVSTARALGTLRDKGSAEHLIRHGEKLLSSAEKTKARQPNEKTELLEIATALAQILPNTEDERAIIFLNRSRMADSFSSGENEAALARIAPKAYVASRTHEKLAYADRRVASALAQGLAVIAGSNDQALKDAAIAKLAAYINGMATGVKPRYQSEMLKAIPDLQRTNAAFKPSNLDEILRGLLENDDVNVRTTAAELIGRQPSKPENIDALKKAFARGTIMDRTSDDAMLAIVTALNTLNKKESVGILLAALESPNYLLRRRAFQLLADADLQKDFPGIAVSIADARSKGRDKVLPFTQIAGTRLGQVLNSDRDYRRALSRRNGSVQARFVTTKGSFAIDLAPEDAPLTVDNFIRLANSKYFDGSEVHRVVAHFVMQDGDPTGTGSGGPGHSIRCEINMLPFERGSVGMALSGKDTGGSQWFVDHSPQPHLDGGYTVFGKVNEEGMSVVDKIVRGDKLISVRVIEIAAGRGPRRPR